MLFHSTDENKVSLAQLYPKAKANVSQTVGINLESLSLPSQSQALSADTDSWRRTGQTEVPRNKHHLSCTHRHGDTLRGEANETPDNGGTAYQRVPSAFFYKRLMYSHASVGAVRYYRHSLSPLRQTHLMTHAMVKVEEEEEQRCCSCICHLLTSPQVEKPEPSGVRREKGASDHSSGWYLHDLTAERHPVFSELPPETSNYTFQRSHKSDFVG